MPIKQHTIHINTHSLWGKTTEHTFCGHLQQIIRATNEPKRPKCGAPNYNVRKPID